MSRKTHHEHSSTKGYRRLLDALAELDGVHSVATGRVTAHVVADRPAAVETAMAQRGWTTT